MSFGGVHFKSDVYIVVRENAGEFTCTIFSRKDTAVSVAIADSLLGGYERVRVDVYHPCVSSGVAVETVFDSVGTVMTDVW